MQQITGLIHYMLRKVAFLYIFVIWCWLKTVMQPFGFFDRRLPNTSLSYLQELFSQFVPCGLHRQKRHFGGFRGRDRRRSTHPPPARVHVPRPAREDRRRDVPVRLWGHTPGGWTRNISFNPLLPNGNISSRSGKILILI